MAEVTIYTDGASRGNPGRGGYGTILISGNYKKELSEAFRLTTNNRMELLAVIKGLEALKGPGHNVTIYSDSKYVVDSVEKKWVWNWAASHDFRKKKNRDLWLRFLELYKQHKIKFVWVKGHADNALNNRCDELATYKADNGPLQVDKIYEKETQPTQKLFG